MNERPEPTPTDRDGRPRTMREVRSFVKRGGRATSAQLRAIELDTPVVRSANTGISASIDAVGRIEAILPSQQAGTLLVHPVPSTSVPTSVFLGDSVAFLALLGACVGLLPVGKQKAARPQL